MHRLLFEHQTALDAVSLARYESELGLDMPVFVSELANHTHFPSVHADFIGGAKSGVNGTPTFFINACVMMNRTISIRCWPRLNG